MSSSEEEKLYFKERRLLREKQLEQSDAWHTAHYRIIEEGNEGTQCIQCSGRNVEYVFRQTRSADEGMTVFYTCRDCNRQWHE
jgi:DNA-directed RNA polymerase subunit M/transcription elongation factor TFIIS